jgi:phosphatidylinositol alpha-1,6-mannosyltransferase
VFGTPWPLVLLGPRLARAGLRYAVIVHGAELIVPAAVPLLRRKVAEALSRAALLLPVSGFTGGHVTRLLEATGRAHPPMSVLRARVDLQRFHPDVDTSAVSERYGLGSRPVALCFGRLVPRKGVDRLIRAMPAIASRVPGALLLVAGTGPEERKLRRLADDVGANVVFAGRVPDEDAPAVYARADVFALAVADRWFGLEIEGLGVVLLEAAACGVPCVTGRSGGTSEAVLDGITGYVVDADAPALPERIVALLSDDAARAAMGAAGRAHVAENFSTAAATDPLLKWLDAPDG